MICYAVIDTNVLVSALLSGNDDAATVQVVRRLLCGEIVPVFSKEIVREYREVLCRAKFGFSPDAVDRLISSLETDGIFIEPSASGVTLPDMKDLPFYEVVLEKRKETDAAYLVTGNIKHFPVRTFIVTPRELLDILAGSS
ncbi:MAG: putative toxin-antitoxin system toxin component, PIN family [Clostridia bacterium]|nr:putative toxin-antitoxin system toxin component, PIN family [Clostridia bacterium]